MLRRWLSSSASRKSAAPYSVSKVAASVLEGSKLYKFPSGPIRTADEYVASLRNRKLVVYVLGERVDDGFVDHPIVKPSVNAMAETYRLAESDPDLATVHSKIVGGRVHRFTHVCESKEDVAAQNKMQRRLGQLTGTCFMRCVGMDAINAGYTVSYRVDQAHGTCYHDRFLDFVRHVQSNNLVVGGAMTDPKGDRSKPPHEQEDMFLRVVERRDGGVVLRGAKTHQTGTLNSHYFIVMPGQRLGKKEDAPFAISAAVSVDSPGLSYVLGRQSCDTRALEGEEKSGERQNIDVGNAKFGGQEVTILFDDVWVPNEQVFLDGECEFAAELVERFTAYHRRSYVCKSGVGDTLIGAAAEIAAQNGVSSASHIKDKLVEMTHLNETIWATGYAASLSASQTSAGNFEPDVLIANVCKHHVTRFPYEIARLAQDLAGGLVATMPSEKDFDDETVGPLLAKYLGAAPGVDPHDRRRILRFIENLTMGRNAVGYLTESMHGAGSPAAQRVLINKLAEFDKKRQLARNLAGCGCSSSSPCGK